VRKLATLALICTFAIFVSAEAHATPCSYTKKPHRILSKKLRKIGFTLCDLHFAKGSAAHKAVERGLEDLNAVQESGLTFYIKGYDGHKEYADAIRKDGHIRMDIVKAPKGKGGFAGRCLTRAGKKGIGEFDVVFNKKKRWNFGEPKAFKTKYKGGFFTSVMLHEVCHGLGFAHSHKLTKDISIMGAGTGKWMGQLGFGIKPWDHGHIRFHYGSKNASIKPDLVLSNYETIKEAKGAPLRLTTGLSVTQVKAGERLIVDWTRFNTGAAIKKAYKMRIVLTRNPNQSKQGLVVKEWTQKSPVADSSTAAESIEIKIPATCKPGTYHVVVRVDVDGALKEQKDGNNHLFIHKKLEVRSKKRRMFNR
jgi:hypothetical protein